MHNYGLFPQCLLVTLELVDHKQIFSNSSVLPFRRGYHCILFQSDVLGGVPQGTVLGPVLFLIMINDINNGIDSNVSLFADDTRIIKPVMNHTDVEELQEDLETLYQWQERNNMAFNSNKFEVLRYG